MEFLILLSQSHPNFRIPELESLADLYNIKLEVTNYLEESPFIIVKLDSIESAQKLIKRTILCRAIYELWGSGINLQSLHESVKEKSSNKWIIYKNSSFKFDFIGYKGSRTKSQQIEIIESFKYLDFQGKIKMKTPDQVFSVLEEYEVFGREAATIPKKLWFGRLIQTSGRDAVDQYDLKRRKYIGTTSFEAELSLVTANMAQVGPGTIMYDPFAGTGSFLVTGGKFGALTIGSDIDVRAIKGKGNTSISANFKQYGTSNKFLDVMTMDFTHNSLRPSFKLDSIVCDPPYGVREGLKVLGTRSKDAEALFEREKKIIEGKQACLRPDYIAPKKPYELDFLLDDLLEFAANNLKTGGRLCFWMPTANEDFKEHDIPLHPKLELIYNCVQEFNKWSRRLLVYVRREADYNGPSVRAQERASIPGFRDKYFSGFH